LYAFHAFKDTFNNVFTLNDAFVISYYESVSPAEIDSIENAMHVELIEGPLDFTGTRVMKLTPQTDSNCLDVANAFYESGLVKYSQPCMFRPHLDQFEPNDPSAFRISILSS